jgi:hypothetical protein
MNYEDFGHVVKMINDSIKGNSFDEGEGAYTYKDFITDLGELVEE